MYLRLTLALLASILAFNSALAQRVRPYTAPRTEYGHPDFQGVWATAQDEAPPTRKAPIPRALQGLQRGSTPHLGGS